ncbi:MAG: HEAT repeat domain-containing protein [Planctomycetota bacterium]
MRRTVALLLVAVAVGCASAGKGDSGKSSKAPPPKEEPAKATATDEEERAAQHAGTGEEFTPTQRAKMEVYWDAFKTESPTWPPLREEWLAMGQKAKLTLCENMLRAMILARLANQPRFATMARTELIFLGKDTVPLLENVLAKPDFYNPASKKVERLSTGVQNELFELLLINEAAAVPSLIRLTKSEVDGIRWNALECLGRLKDRRGTQVLMEVLRTSDRWTDRMTAAKALGYVADPQAARALVKALDDEDESVVITAAGALARQVAVAALPALDERVAKANASDEWKIGRACADAAKMIRTADALKKADQEAGSK